MKKQSEGEETRRKEKNQNQKISVVVNYLNICMNDTKQGRPGQGCGIVVRSLAEHTQLAVAPSAFLVTRHLLVLTRQKH